jgi:hypothetical protein
MLSRMAIKKGNIWALNLEKTLEQKLMKKLINKGEVTQLLRVHIASAENIMRNMIKANQKKKLFISVDAWLNGIQVIPNERIRENLYNIEQYRADALNI